MDELDSSPFSGIKIPSDSQVDYKNNILFISKWNWDYKSFLEFQTKCQKIISKNRGFKVYIFCNHPHLFTLGRGNERDQESLIEFDESLIDSLDFPVHKIHRGGGITFHFPGQWIFYPIVSISEKYTLDDHMCWMLKSVKNAVSEAFDIDGLITAKKLMGVWHNKKKLASIGVGLNRFVSEHGIALNLKFDDKMKSGISKISPCGMNSNIYTSISDILDENKELVETLNFFQNTFIKYIDNAK